MRRISQPLSFVLAIASLLIVSISGCTAANTASSTSNVLAVSLSASTVVVAQDGTPATLGVNISGVSGAATVVVSGLPAGVTSQFTPLNGGPSGTLTFIGGSGVQMGSNAATVTVTASNQTQSQGFTVITAIVAKISSTVDTTLGASGYLNQFMSTSFQIAGFTGNYFGTGSTTTAREAALTALAPQHIRLQAIGSAVPMTTNTGAAADWDFTLLDQIVQPVLASADKSPEFQIAVAPAWMLDANGNLDTVHHLNDFAAYAANLVRYYNKGGFTWGGQTFVSPSAQPITWWGIFNEPNLTGLTPAQYSTLYNTVVPAMLAVDPTLKFSALEFSDYGFGTGQAGDPQLYLPTFLAPVGSGGVSAQVNSISTHLYGVCNQLDTDAILFAAVPQFVANIQYFYQELALRSDLAQVPVWVTENNVNADYPIANGMSNCNAGQTFVTDPRGSSAFFAAWRPYVFSQLGKAGNRALYQWLHTGSAQYGEVDANGTPYLSYWVDRALQNAFPLPSSGNGPQILKTTVNDTTSLEVLATKSSNGTVTVMIVDRAVHVSADNNGVGDPRVVVVDLSSLNSFSSASVLTVDAGTNLTTGPAAVTTPVSTRIPVTLSGYGVAFLTLTP
jgi:hypothetical protein